MREINGTAERIKKNIFRNFGKKILGMLYCIEIVITQKRNKRNKIKRPIKKYI